MDISDIKLTTLPTPEHMLGRGSLMPFNCANSGVRKLMFGTNLEQKLSLVDPDVPYVSTGYEAQFGEYSSSFEVADDDYTVLAKIPKFSNSIKGHYYAILVDSSGLNLRVVERVSYKHITESYGYMYNNDTLDNCTVGSKILKGEVIKKSESFDEYNNRKDGKNLLLAFNSSEYTMEDAIVISESCSHKLASPLIHKVKIIINDNDIPLNIYGNEEQYKIFPDVGDNIVEGILCALRREKKEEALFSQSFNRLNIPTVSDDKIVVSGRVVDIDIYCNAPEKLAENPYCGQIYQYYLDHISMCKLLIDTVKPYLDHGAKMSYDLQKLYHKCLDELDCKPFFNERIFSYLNIDITVIEEIPVIAGDKLTNRYGGKGVISKVLPDRLMPKTQDGLVVDIQANFCGVYGRENMGQVFEMSANYISRHIAKAINSMSDFSSLDECVKMLFDYLEIISPSTYKELSEVFDRLSDDEISIFMASIVQDEMLYLDIDPVSETLTLGKLKEIYNRFPWIQQEKTIVPVVDSNNNIQYVPSRRPMVVGHVYYYRLKQYGKEKFSVVSLSATNIKNENSRNKSSKVYKSRFSRTPIRFGDMELGNLNHMGAELAVQLLMLYAASPEGRMLSESLMTDDPFHVDVRLNDDASNRNIEILNTYLKTIGLRIVFKKIPKKKNIPVSYSPIVFDAASLDNKTYNPIRLYPKNEILPKEYVESLCKNQTFPVTYTPIIFDRDTKEIKLKLIKISDEDKSLLDE